MNLATRHSLPTRNQQWCVARRPSGNVVADDFKLAESAVPDCADGQILLSTLFLNLAPVMRQYMSGTSVANEKPLAIGDVLHGRGIAQVVESRHPDFVVGDVIQGQLGWQLFKASSVTPEERIFKIPNRGVSYGYSLGPLGMTGFSAYCGFFGRGMPKSGETVVVSAAAGGGRLHRYPARQNLRMSCDWYCRRHYQMQGHRKILRPHDRL